jgi:transcriptional regulator with XRE-family HTH domain
MTIGKIVKQRREAKRWNQQELADKADVTQATISRLEAGVFDPKISSLRSIAAALGCSVVDLLPESDKKKQPLRTDTQL